MSRRALGVHNTSCDIYNLVEQPKLAKMSSRFSSNRRAGPTSQRDRVLAEAAEKIKLQGIESSRRSQVMSIEGVMGRRGALETIGDNNPLVPGTIEAQNKVTHNHVWSNSLRY